MTPEQIYIAISVVVFAIILVILILKGKGIKQARMSRLSALALMFVLFGIIFGDDRIIGYGLMGVGVLLAVIDIIKKYKQKKNFPTNSEYLKK